MSDNNNFDNSDDSNLIDQPIKIIVSKGKLSTTSLIDITKECFGEINSLPDKTFEITFKSIDETAIPFERYSIFISILKNFGGDIKSALEY